VDAALLSGWAAVDLFDDGWPEKSAMGPWQILGDTAALLRDRERYGGAVVAIGGNATRLGKQRHLSSASLSIATVIHPRAVVSPFAVIGAGTVIFAGAVVNAFARVGEACIVNTGASVDHDCDLDHGVHVSPGARLAGGVRVGEASWIGIGAVVKEGTVIGARAIVGAGAVVLHDVPDGVTVIGAPARPVRC
jgi:sugar O-acyltransferase (sialic acid O-acetyltransferase NeuD family)